LDSRPRDATAIVIASANAIAIGFAIANTMATKFRQQSNIWGGQWNDGLGCTGEGGGINKSGTSIIIVIMHKLSNVMATTAFVIVTIFIIASLYVIASLVAFATAIAAEEWLLS
jgi:hypothetical protein